MTPVSITALKGRQYSGAADWETLHRQVNKAKNAHELWHIIWWGKSSIYWLVWDSWQKRDSRQNDTTVYQFPNDGKVHILRYLVHSSSPVPNRYTRDGVQHSLVAPIFKKLTKPCIYQVSWKRCLWELGCWGSLHYILRMSSSTPFFRDMLYPLVWILVEKDSYCSMTDDQMTKNKTYF